MQILGIETSCDETSASVAEIKSGKIKILSNIISSQIEIHKKYGGVVPEIAAREHALDILPVINESLERSGIKVKEASKKIKAIAVATGPGLMTSLIAGVETAKALSYAWNIPAISINHINGHISANFIDRDINKIKFPAIILTVSGGHTILILMEGFYKYKIIGETRDDAAGEAFDKAAKLMNIGYPGGPIVSVQSEKFKMKKNSANDIHLPRPMENSDDFDFSFSGLKTALRYKLEKDKKWKTKIPEYCHEFQQAVVDVLLIKTIRAVEKFNAKTVMLAGGVSANKKLRFQFVEQVGKLNKVQFIMPNLEYTTDNAAMIAAAGCLRALKRDFIPWKKLKADCNFKLK